MAYCPICPSLSERRYEYTCRDQRKAKLSGHFTLRSGRDDINPVVALCVIDRQTGGRESLASAGIELRSLYTMEQIENAR